MLIESRDIAFASALGVFALLIGFFVGRHTDDAPPEAPVAVDVPVAAPVADDRPTAAEAKERADAVAVVESQLAGLTLRLGPDRLPWPDDTPHDQRPARFYEHVRAMRQVCDLRFNLVGVECAEPPCIAALRQVDKGLAAAIPGCAAWTGAYPGAPIIDAGPVPCADGSSETVVLLSAPLPADAARDARLIARQKALRSGWTCAPVIHP